MGLPELRAGLTRAAYWEAAGVLKPKMSLQELRAGSAQLL